MIVLVVALVLACTVFACIGAVGLGLYGGAAEKQETVEQAEGHWNKATQALEQASGLLGESKDQGATEAAKTADKELRVLRDELAASRASIEALDADEAGRSEYLASLDAANKAADGLQDMLAYIVTADQMTQGISNAAASAKSGNSQLEKAIDAANGKKWAAMERAAKTASTAYSSAISGFKAAHKLDPRAGLDKAAAYCASRKKQADLVVKMAADGKAGRWSAYNVKVDQQAALDQKAEKTKEPDIVTDPNWVENRLSSLGDAISEAGEKADELHLDALRKLGDAD